MRKGQPKRFYVFGVFRIDVTERVLLGEQGPVSLTPKAFDLLLCLVENSGHILAKDELMQQVWPDSFVEENNLAQNISTLRKALEAGGEKFIETVPRRGYRFAATVNEIEDEVPALVIRERTRSRIVIEESIDDELVAPPLEQSIARPPDLPASRVLGPSSLLQYGLENPPETMYARSGDVNIAYQVIGDAPLDLVFVMGWVSHLEYFWREPSFARFLLRLASFARLILFDKRGTGLSDRVPINELPTLEQRMDDVRAVMDAVGSERAALCGVSEGGPMCSLFAATYPEKTLALVMIGTYAKRIRDDDYPWAPTPEHRQEFFEEMSEQWGGPVGLEERAPSVANDPQFRQWWATYLRMGASPGAALALTQMNAEIDVRHVLPSIRVPTLVIHRSEDQCLKVEEGRYVAGKIPGAKYVELPGRDHLPFVGDQDAILDEVEEFLTGVRHTLEPDRVLATVLFTQIVDSQEHAQRLGEMRWEALLDKLRAHVRKEIEWFRGRDIDMVGDRPLAIFDGPARAIRCASAIRQYAARLGVQMRIGLHTGECDMVDGKVGGIAAEIGVQVANQAAPDEVLVSSTVKDLVAGSGIQFAERGAHQLTGVPGEWRLFAVER
ncbi:MAG: eukaryotic-like serine/threonine-protein kinase [Blastocatellia bacterium]|jgi:DNA-binding winged helix-turn-helix (wHTH) protein/pimeloyl-ACP methyl ester carboxylesterase|nr:eukaryotic-like serine/threonine-protein kinase [Blastocatellia bacterium]